MLYLYEKKSENITFTYLSESQSISNGLNLIKFTCYNIDTDTNKLFNEDELLKHLPDVALKSPVLYCTI